MLERLCVEPCLAVGAEHFTSTLIMEMVEVS